MRLNNFSRQPTCRHDLWHVRSYSDRFDYHRTGEVLLRTYNRLVAELEACRELTQKLGEQSAAMTAAAEMARLGKEKTLASRDEVSDHLKKLKDLVAEREREVRSS